MDETFWRINFDNNQVIGLTNSDHRKVNTTTNPKMGFTAVFVISAAGIFLKPTIILQGSTNRSLNKINEINKEDINKKYTHSGWINVEIIIDILNDISKISQNNDAVLILDKFPTHLDDIVIRKANELKIELVYVPKGRTAENQPLDVGINGPIKSIGKMLANKIFIKDPFVNYTLVNSIKSLIQATKMLTPETIIKSFSAACNIN